MTYSHSITRYSAYIDDTLSPISITDEFQTYFALFQYRADGVFRPLSRCFQSGCRQRRSQLAEATISFYPRLHLVLSGVTVTGVYMGTADLAWSVMTTVRTSCTAGILAARIVMTTVSIASVLNRSRNRAIRFSPRLNTTRPTFAMWFTLR